MNISFIDARGSCPEEVLKGVNKNNNCAYAIQNIASKDLQALIDHLSQNPELKLHTQFSSVVPEPRDIFLADQKYDIHYDGNRIIRKLKAKDISGYDFKSIVEFSLNEVYIFNTTDYKFQFVNQGALDNLGYSKSQIHEMTPLDIKPEFSKKQFDETVAPLITGIKEKVIFSTVHQRKDKSLYPVEVHLQIMEHNGVPFFVAVILDITEWKKAINTTKETKDKMVLLAQNYPDGSISLIDKDFKILFTDGEGYRQHGINPAHIIGKYAYEAFPGRIFNGIREAVDSLKNGAAKKYKVSFENRIYENTIKPIYDKTKSFKYFVLRVNDITENVKTQEEILIERNRHASITKAIENSSLVSITDTKGIITSANKDFCDVSQYSEKELIGKSHSIINSGYHPKSFWAGMWKKILVGKPWRGEVKNKAKDGTFYWVDTVINPITDIEGKIVNFLSICHLITEKKELELAKDKLTERLKLATRAAKMGIWTWDPDTNEVTWDENNFNLYGVDSYDGTFDGYMKMIHPEDVDKVLYEGKRIASQTSDLNYSFRVVRPDGKISHLKSMASKEVINGKTIVVGVNWDVTQEREAKSKLLQLTNKLSLATKAAKAGVWTWDLKTGEVIWDNQMKAIYGRIDFDGDINTFKKFIHPDDVDGLFKEVNSQIHSHKSFNFSFRIIKPNNEIAHIKAMSTLDIINGNELLVGVNWDITKEKESENNLLQLTNKLSLASRAANMGIWSNNLKTGIIEWDVKTCSIFGVKIFPGIEKWTDLIHPDDREHVILHLDEAIKDRQDFDRTFRIIVNGKIKYVKSMGTRERSEDSDILIGVCWDVTEDELAEQELRATNEELVKLKKFIDLSSDAIQVSDESGRLVYINNTAAGRLGIPKDKVSNYYVKDFEVLFKDDNDWKKHLKELKKKGKLIIESVNINQENNTTIPIEVTITYQKIGGQGYVIASSRDITERQEAQKKFELALKGSNDGYFDADLITNKTYYSDRYLEMFGLEGHDNILDRGFWQSYIHPDDRERIFKIIENTLNNNVPTYEFELRMFHTNGTIMPTLIRAFVTRNSAGEPVRVTGTLMDMTKIKAAERQITLLKDDYSNLLNSVDGIIWKANPATFEFNFISNQVQQITGYSKEEWLNEKNFWVNHMHPEDRKWAPQYCMKTTKKLENHDFEYRFIKKDGSVIWIRDLVTVISKKGIPTELMGIMLDITNIKKTQLALLESENKFKIISDNATDGLVIVENDHIVFASKGYLKITGYTQDEALSLTKDDLYNTIHPDDRESTYKKLSDCRERKATTLTYQFRQQHKRGHYVWRENTANYIYDENGKLSKQIIVARDISERKAIEIALSESEEKHRFIVESSNELICTHKPTGEYKYVSPSILKITGYTPEELIGKDPYTFIHPADKERVLKTFHLPVLEGKSTSNIQYRAAKKDGAYIWLDTYMSVIKDDDGTILSLISGSRDVTETVEAQLKLKASEERFRAIADNMPGVVYQCLNDDDFTITYLNEEIENLTGYTKNEFFNDEINFVKLYHPDDKNKVLKDVEDALKKHEPFHLTYRLYNKDIDDWLWVEEFGQGVFEDQELSYLEGVILNIHKSKLTSLALEKTLHQLNLSIETGKLGIWETNLATGRLDWNDQMHEIFGLEKEDFDHNIETFYSMVHPDDLDTAGQEMSKIADGQTVRDVQFRIKRPDGSTRHIYASGAPAYNDKGEVVKFIGINIDVTHVAEYQEQLEATLKEKDALFKELHHRIKNNLQMVSSLLFIKSTMTDDITLRRFIDETSTKIHSISSIHEQLLQLQGVNELDVKDYLISLCQNLVRTYSYGSTRFDLEMELDSAEMNIDKVLNIGLIVNEIISNTMKYAYPNSDVGKIYLSLKNNNNQSILIVSDDGIGIPKEKMSDLDNSYGMQLISLFAKQIKATLNINNSKGTMYTITFPTHV